MRSDAPTTTPLELLTRVAFYLALVIVAARLGTQEIIRDPFPISPGDMAAPRPAGPGTSLFLDLLCCVPALLILLRRAMDSTYVLRWGWSHVVMTALAAWAMLSRLWAADRFTAMVSSANLAAGFVLIWSATQLVRSHARLRIVAGLSFGLLLVLVAQGLNQRLVDFPTQVKEWNDPKSPTSRWALMRQNGWEESDFSFQQYERKLLSGELRGFFNSPNTYAAMLVLCGLISFGILMQRLKDHDGLGWAAIILIAIAGGLYVLWHTHSRTAALTPILGIILILFLARIEPWMAQRARLVFAVAAILFFLGVAAVVGHGLAHGNLVEKSLTYRWYYWTGAWRMLAKHPITGVGWDNFGSFYPEFRLPVASEEVQDPHNFFVRFFAELGIVGGILTIVWMACLWWEMTRPTGNSPISLPPQNRKRILSFIALALGAAFLNLLASTDFDQDSNWILLQMFGVAAGAVLLLFGLVVGSIRSIHDWQLDERPAPWILRSMQIAIGMFLLHNLIDFSLFEIGPLMLFCFLTGSVLGVRQPSVAGKRKRTAIAVGGLIVATILWLGALAQLWLPTLFAELASARGDELFRTSLTRDKLLDLSRLDAAFSAYQQAMREQPINAEYAAKAARVLNSRNAPPTLIKPLIDAAIAANPRIVRYFIFKAEYELHQPKPDDPEVMKAYQSALGLDPNDVGLRLKYAAALEKLGDKDFAKEQYREALHRDNQLPKDEPKRLPAKKRKEIEDKIR